MAQQLMYESKTAGASTDMYVEFSATYQEHANKVTATSTYRIEKVATELKKAGTGGTWECKIYTGASTPTTLVATSVSVDMNVALPDTTNFAYVEFVFPTPYHVASGEVYWIVLNNTSTYSNTNYIWWKYLVSGSAARIYYWNGSSWINTGYTGFSDANYKVYGTYDLKIGLKGLYHFSGNANDTSGNGYNLTATGLTYTNDKNNVANQAGSFSSGSAYETGYTLGATGSVSVWFKNNSASAVDEAIFSNTKIGVADYLGFRRFNSGGSYWISVMNTTYTDTVNGADTNWHNIVVTWNSSTGWKYYFDGKLIYNYTTGVNPTNSYYPRLGAWTDGNIVYGAGPRYWNGLIDETRLYNRQLNDTEVIELYESYDTAIEPDLTTGLKCYYKLDEASGNALDEVSGAHLTATNSTGSVVGKITNARGPFTVNTATNYFNNNSMPLTFGYNKSFSITGWVKINGVGSIATDNHPIFSTSSATNDFSARLELNKTASAYSTLSFYLSKSFVTAGDSIGRTVGKLDQKFADGDIIFFGATYDGVAHKYSLYINNILIGTSTNTGASTATDTTKFYLMKDIQYGSNQVGGLDYVDEIGIWNRELSQDEVMKIYNATQGLAFPLATPTTKVNSNLVADWKFTGNTNDSSGNKLTLTNSGATLTTDKNAVSNQAYDFSGSSQYMYTANRFMNGFKKCTVSMWFYFDTNTNYRTLFTNYDGANTENCFMCIYNGGQLIYGQFYGTDGTTAGANTADGAYTGLIGTGTWHHMVWVWDGTANVKIYHQGNFLTTLQGNLNQGTALRTSTGNLWIGGQTGFSRWVDGKMDEIRVWDRDLSHSEILELYKGYDNVSEPTSNTGLKAYYNLSNLNDSSGNGWTLTATGNATTTTDKKGVAAQAYTFDGSGDYLQSATSFSSTFANKKCISVSMWIYPTDAKYSAPIIIRNQSDGASNYMMFLHKQATTNVMRWAIYNGTVQPTVEGTIGLTLNTWNHCVGTYNGGVMKMYINGTLERQNVYTGISLKNDATIPLNIGRNGTATTQDYAGKIDEVRIYERELSQSEVLDLFYGYDTTANKLITMEEEPIPVTDSFGRNDLVGQSFTPNASWTVNGFVIKGSKGGSSSATNYYSIITDKIDQWYGTPGILNGLGSAVNWEAQTFTAGSSYTIKNVLTRICRTGTANGNITVSIRATSGGLPTGADLCSGTFARSLLGTETSNANWMRINLGAGTALTSGTMYAIVIRSDTEDGTNYTRLATDIAGTYAGGNRCFSSNSGSSWSNSGATGHDLCFMCLGDCPTFEERNVVDFPAYTTEYKLMTIPLTTPVTLTNGTKYNFLVVPKQGSETDELRWSWDIDSPAISNGASIKSGTEDSTKDRLFSIYGTVGGAAFIGHRGFFMYF